LQPAIGMAAMTASERLAAHALGLAWHALAEPVRDAARMFLLDTIGVGIAGRNAPYAAEIFACEARGSQGQARVFGAAQPLSAASAAFVNAYQIHAQEFDCVHEAAVLHPLSAVLGALTADCTGGTAADGPGFGAALVAGVDVAVCLGLAARGPLKFFRPATAGIFGAVAALARLRRLTQGQTVSAFGHALAFVSGTMQAHLEGMPGLALQVAAAARNAVIAVDLAEMGVPGVRGSIDGDFGYLALFEHDQDLPPQLDTLGKTFAITAVSHKPFPTGRAAHGGIAAVQALCARHGVSAGDIASLRYMAPSLIARLVGRPAHAGMGVAYARLCLPYLAAHTLLHGGVGLDAFSAGSLADPAVLDLAGRIGVEIDDNPDVAAFVPATLRASLRDGSGIDIAVPALPGSVAAPLDARARLRKLADCLAFVGSELAAEPLTERVEHLDQEPDMGALLGLVCSASPLISRQP
jgi:2-methylcitrate dehydratase PrpD